MTNTLQVKKIDGVKILLPFCEKAKESLDDFHVNQVVTTGKISGTRKVRSLIENNLYFKACSVFREMMMPDPRWKFASVDLWFRHYCQYYDHKKTIVLPDNGVHFQVLPLNFAGCVEAQANGYYNNAFTAQADFLGIENKEAWIKEVKSRMK